MTFENGSTLSQAVVASDGVSEALPLKFGSNVSIGFTPFQGDLDEVRIANEAITLSELGASGSFNEGSVPEPQSWLLLLMMLGFYGSQYKKIK